MRANDRPKTRGPSLAWSSVAVLLAGLALSFGAASGSAGCSPGSSGAGGTGSATSTGPGSEPQCGDGIADPDLGEECDDGNLDDTDECLSTCKRARCGDGIVEVGVEQCDDGNSDDTDACPTTCNDAACGDGFLEKGVEQCDDGNEIDTDACNNQCKAGSGCGNGKVDPGEECDDGNKSNADACTNQCKNAVCGDGYAELGVEDCDDGNTVDDDACSNACKVNTFSSYGCPGIPVLVDANLGQTVGGTISMSTNAYGGTCGGNGAELVYAVTPAVSGVLTLEMLGVSNDVDPVLYVRDACEAGSELGCVDKTFSGGSETLVLPVVGGQTYWVFADTYSTSSTGDFLLAVDLSTMVSGDDCPGQLVPLAMGETKTLNGNTAAATANRTGTGACNSPSTKDIVYKIAPTVAGTIYATVDPSYDASLYVRASSCTLIASQIACSETGGIGVPESLAVPVTAGQSYYFIVDGHNGAAGAYSVDFTFGP